jgi:putative membrane-bound dehydrogenase-like protein
VIVRYKILAMIVVCSVAWCHAEVPVELDPKLQFPQSGVRLTLLAEHPDVVTPTGIDVDASGNIWAVASHTHFRPDDYDGPQHDEVVVFAANKSDAGKSVSGYARTVFYNKTVATMDLELGRNFESDGWVYLAQRDRIFRVRDTDGDGRGDQEQNIALLETEADYPHNGLSGLAWHPSGDLIFSLGENFAKAWTLTAADGSTATGSGEGGVFRCQADGTSLRRIAWGFWNPFGICVRDDGTMFAAENDPGARPPCRLLHVVDGGDYGYQRLYGSAPFHPFVCWNGELRGTLPMLHGLGEAPCGIAELGNGLVVPSWTEHRIDFYPLATAGASFTTERVTLVIGGDHFRPTCITQHSPNVFFLTDWVYGSYKLHGRGRIWKLEIDPEAAAWLGDREVPPANKAARIADELRSGGQSFSDEQLFQFASGADPFMSLAAIDALSSRTASYTTKGASELDRRDRISLLLAIRKSDPQNRSWVRYFLGDSDVEIRFETLRWIADARLKDFLPDVESLLRDPDVAYQIFESSLAAWNALSGKPELGVADAGMLISRVTDADASPRTRAFALRLLDPSHKRFSADLWQDLYNTGDPLLISELTRALASQGSGQAKEFLLRIASDDQVDMATRGDAVAGLSGPDGATLESLVGFAESADSTLREEALRSLRFAEMDAGQRKQLEAVAAVYPGAADLVRAAVDPASVKRARPELSDISSWQKRLAAIEQPIDVLAGRRIFHHATVGTCVKCHRHTGRGSAVGPDLSAASNVGDPDRLLRSLLQPSRDIDPQYFPRMLVTADGHVFTGIMLRDGGGGKEFYRDSNGREKAFMTADIVQRKELNTSMMPEGLIDLMTDREIRDLMAFLDQSSQRLVSADQERSP